MLESDCLKLCNRLYCDPIAENCSLTARQVAVHRKDLMPSPLAPELEQLKADILAILGKLKRKQYDRGHYQENREVRMYTAKKRYHDRKALA